MKNYEKKNDHATNVNNQPQYNYVEQHQNADGEMYVNINDIECRTCVLVWEAFNGEIPEGYDVTHIDGDPTNNRLDNLKLEKI